MKKNAMLKIAAILLVAVLLTTCAISTTFAKYVTNAVDGTEQSARVAKWGVKFTAAADDVDPDEPIFLEELKKSEGFYLYQANEEIVAPGQTNTGKIFGVTAEGTPEVAFKLTATVDVKFENWTKEGGAEYLPLSFKIGGTTVTLTGDTNDLKEEALEKALAAAIVGGDATKAVKNDGTEVSYSVSQEYTAGTPVTDVITAATFTWAWDGGNDTDDTYLGNVAATGDAAAAKIIINYSLAAEQIVE